MIPLRKPPDIIASGGFRFGVNSLSYMVEFPCSIRAAFPFAQCQPARQSILI